MSKIDYRITVALSALLVAVAAPLLGLPDFYLHLLVLMMIFAVFAMSLDILMGYGGLPSLGHAAFFGIAAYSVGIATVKFGFPWWIGSLIALLGCLGVGAIFGLIALRTRGLYFLLITLALGQLLWGAVNRWGSLTGGYNGLPGVPRPVEWLGDTVSFYYLTLAILVAVWWVMKRLMHSPFGLALQAVNDNEVRMSALGYNAWLHRYAAFLIAGLFAGAAGAINAFYTGFVSPRDVSLAMSAEAILMVILGGTRTLWGPLIGAAIIVSLRNFLSIYFDHWLIVLGLIFIVVVIVAPQGIAGWFRTTSKETAKEKDESTSEWKSDDAELSVGDSDVPAAVRNRDQDASGRTSLSVSDLRRAFGGLVAVSDVSFEVPEGQRFALLGPNGAGKTTLFQLISGGLSSDQGTVKFYDHDITKLPMHRRARLGIGRTFQIINLFPSLTVKDHLRLSAISYYNIRFNMTRDASKIPHVEEFVASALAGANLEEFGEVRVENLSYGHQRQLEIAMTVSMQPKLLLLDEPAAGLSIAEIGSVLKVLNEVDRSITIVLIEHDMDLVFEVSDQVIVFDHGKLITQGLPQDVRENPEVKRIYLGGQT
ncbi:ABC transporter permease subunit [Pararhodobacter oceanensis]|uniref:branched-chain amino acid ABC transporter ATP-binding protein/permease n=1 Tax=Pararhodobacter oceanensis TaxID=2172121 RepID=UPI003A9314F8